MTYGEDGQLTGWRRSAPDRSGEFTADGKLADGRPVTYATLDPATPWLIGWFAEGE